MAVKPIWWRLVFSVLLLMSIAEVAGANPVQGILRLYEAEFVDQDTLEPYIASILALNEVERNRSTRQVKAFIQWYFDKMNYPDYQGLRGTVYVHKMEGEREISLRKYDSVDAYAGLFLHLLHVYADKSGDVALLKNNWGKIDDLAELILTMQDQDGLTWAKPDYKVKYLMDNCEAYGGLVSYAKLLALTGQPGSKRHEVAATILREGILAQLFDESNVAFYWAKDATGAKSRRYEDRFFPDSFAQIFPIYFDLLAEQKSAAMILWSEIMRRHGGSIRSLPCEQRIMLEFAKRKIEGMIYQ